MHEYIIIIISPTMHHAPCTYTTHRHEHCYCCNYCYFLPTTPASTSHCTTCAQFLPAAPMTPPPGWQPAEHMYKPCGAVRKQMPKNTTLKLCAGMCRHITITYKTMLMCIYAA